MKNKIFKGTELRFSSFVSSSKFTRISIFSFVTSHSGNKFFNFAISFLKFSTLLFVSLFSLFFNSSTTFQVFVSFSFSSLETVAASSTQVTSSLKLFNIF